MNINETLCAQRKGRAMQEAQAKLAEIVKACRATGKKGVLTLRLEIQPTGEDDTVIIDDSITAKIPEPSKGSTTFYTTEDGELSREDPKQREFTEVVEASEAAN